MTADLPKPTSTPIPPTKEESVQDVKDSTAASKEEREKAQDMLARQIKRVEQTIRKDDQ